MVLSSGLHTFYVGVTLHMENCISIICAYIITYIYIYITVCPGVFHDLPFALAKRARERERERLKDAKVKTRSQDELHVFLYEHVCAETDLIDMHPAVLV